MRRALCCGAMMGLLLLGGCGTIGNLCDHPQAFGGMRNDIPEIGKNPGPCNPGCLLIFDVPFSLALDLALLPFTLVYEIVNPKPDPLSPPPRESVPDANPR